MRQIMQWALAAIIARVTPEEAIEIAAWLLADRARRADLDKRAFRGRFLSAIDAAWRCQARA
jgi:hypothetical protein